MKYLYISFLLLYSFVTYSQDENEASKEIVYTKMVNDDSNLYAINDKGQLVVWDLKTLEKIYKQKDTIPKYTAITKDKNNAVYLGSSKGFVYKLNHCYGGVESFYKPEKKSSEIYFIFFNSRNEMYMVFGEGLYCTKNDRMYNQFMNTGFSAIQRVTVNGIKPSNVYFDVPTVAFIDSNDRIWMSDCMGEFGCTRNTFDANNNKILDEVTELNSIQSFTEDDSGNIYVTQGLQHMMNSGSIIQVIPNLEAIKLYSSYETEYSFENCEHEFNNGLFIGPGAWNTAEQKLYFASSDGFYKAAISPNNRLSGVEKLFEPILIAKRENLAIGMQMPVKQVAFTHDNRLLFLTAANGIGVYNGKEYIMLE